MKKAALVVAILAACIWLAAAAEPEEAALYWGWVQRTFLGR